MRMRIQQSGLHRSTVSVNHAGSCKHRTQINCKRMPVRTLRQAALFPIMETKQAVPHKTNWGEKSPDRLWWKSNVLVSPDGILRYERHRLQSLTQRNWYAMHFGCKTCKKPTMEKRMQRKNLPCIRLDSDTSLVSNPTGILRPEVPYWCHYNTSVTKLQDSLSVFCGTLCISNNSAALFLWKNGNIFA